MKIAIKSLTDGEFGMGIDGARRVLLHVALVKARERTRLPQ
jgi:hypothetical protein